MGSEMCIRDSVVNVQQRVVAIRHAELVIVVQVVRCRQDRHHVIEVVLTQPDDFFLAPDSTMVGAKTARSFADGEFVLDDPRQVAGRDSERPFSSQLWWHELSTLLSLTR